VLGVVAVLAVGGFSPFRVLRRTQLAEASPAVTTAPVITRTAITTVESSGAVEPQQQASLALKSAGTVLTVSVQVGDLVQAGDALVTVDLGTAAATLAQAQADLLTAQNALSDLQEPPTDFAIASAQKAVTDAEEAV